MLRLIPASASPMMRAMVPAGRRVASGSQPRYAVVMAGGQGTRFWPRSRRRHPKHLLRVVGRRTLLQSTVSRLVPVFGWQRLLVVTNAEHVDEVRRQLPRLPVSHIVVEPLARNTLPCLLLAAEWIARRASEAVMVAVPADHVITDGRALRHALSAACRLAVRADCLVTIGIAPTRAETGYGYIEVGRPIQGGDGRWVRRFREKPSVAVARRYAGSGRHLWNSGMFVWRTSVFQTAVGLCVPEVQASLATVFRGRAAWRRHGPTVLPGLRRAYRRLPSVSVDYGVLQPISGRAAPAPRVAVVRGDFDWNDIGSWRSLAEVWGGADGGNATRGKIVALDMADAIVDAPDRVVALIGVQGLIVVDSPDALLICARDRAQDVRRVTDMLRARGWSRYL